MKKTVAIPTYQRPEFLRRAVDSILGQKILPDELLLISRDTDRESNELIRDIVAIYDGPVQIRSTTVVEPGFLPPILAAIREATGDLLAVMDDDAVAHPDWLARLSSHFVDPNVAGVGGRVLDFTGGNYVEYPAVSKVGFITWYGKAIGDMYKDINPSTVRPVQFVMGGSMCYRSQVIRRCLPDPVLAANVAFHWEVDVGLQVNRLGYRILYDPSAKVDHFTGPRAEIGMRSPNRAGIYWYNYNYSYLILKHFGFARAAIYQLYALLIGNSGTPGLLRELIRLMSGKEIHFSSRVVPSLEGRVGGFLRAARRRGGEPLSKQLR